MIVAAFVAEHHVERPFVKRKRDRADPEALARGGRGKKDRRMSDPGKFLSRWSRRKREAAEAADATTPPAASEPAVENATARAAPQANLPRRATRAEIDAPTFDLASLPAIESITAETDIRAFLAPGVPPELTRAALRRAWAADPKIRDFVGLADYDWDFNTPGSMAGFGPLEMTEELRQVVARIIGRPPPRTERAARAAWIGEQRPSGRSPMKSIRGARPDQRSG